MPFTSFRNKNIFLLPILLTSIIDKNSLLLNSKNRKV